MAIGAFQSSAFQSSGFQTRAATEARSGDVRYHYPKGRDPADVYKERVRLGIVPAPVQKIVKQMAERVIQRAEERNQPDPLELLQREHDRFQRQLTQLLKEQQIAFERSYMALLTMQIAIAIQDREDQQIIGLLLEM